MAACVAWPTIQRILRAHAKIMVHTSPPLGSFRACQANSSRTRGRSFHLVAHSFPTAGLQPRSKCDLMSRMLSRKHLTYVESFECSFPKVSDAARASNQIVNATCLVISAFLEYPTPFQLQLGSIAMLNLEFLLEAFAAELHAKVPCSGCFYFGRCMVIAKGWVARLRFRRHPAVTLSCAIPQILGIVMPEEEYAFYDNRRKHVSE